MPAALGGDERLARMVAHGHERAFATLYDRYHQRIYRYVRAMVRHDSDAQDVLQTVFTKAFVALAEGRRDAPLRPWLYRIAHNEAISAIRRRRPEVDLTALGDPPAPSVEEAAGERARLAMVVADLQALTERQRGALVLRELSGLSHEEIEAALGLDPGAAKQTIFEARRSLAEFSQGRTMSCDDVCKAISDGSGRTLRGRRIRAHLRDCAGCAVFAQAIPTRSRELRAIAPPLPAAAAAGLLTRVLGHGGAVPAGAAGAGATGVGAGATGVGSGLTGKVAALGITTKLVAGAAVIVVAAGAGGIVAPLLHGAGADHPSATSNLRGRGNSSAHRGAVGSGQATGSIAGGRVARPVAAGAVRSPAASRGAAQMAGHGSQLAGHGSAPAARATAHGHVSSVSAARSHGQRGAQMKADHRSRHVHGRSGVSQSAAASHGRSSSVTPVGKTTSATMSTPHGNPHTTRTPAPKVPPGQAKKSGA